MISVNDTHVVYLEGHSNGKAGIFDLTSNTWNMFTLLPDVSTVDSGYSVSLGTKQNCHYKRSVTITGVIRLGYLRRETFTTGQSSYFHYIEPTNFVTISEFLSLCPECLLSKNLVPWKIVIITELSL